MGGYLGISAGAEGRTFVVSFLLSECLPIINNNEIK